MKIFCFRRSIPDDESYQEYNHNNTFLVPEIERQISQNMYMSNLWKSNFSSPIEQKLKVGGYRILDVGCGSGTWLLELARMYPNNEYYGVDVTPLFPTDNLPGNVQFFIVNVLYDLPFETFTFDFVHQRLLVRDFNTKQWKNIIGELARVTRPYGFIEIMEMDLAPYCQGPTTKKLFEAFLSAMHTRGISPIIKPLLQRMLKSNRSLFNVRTEAKICPIGEWGGIKYLEIGLPIFKLMKRNNLEFMSITPTEYDKLLRTYEREVYEYETFIKTYRFYAQRIQPSFYRQSYISNIGFSKI
ncbi:unnamed protein product [Rhizophagus irregularis]|uniref:S-adenosyl-L-methionine-dependent methyltransferase n=1 Tax=Rhizophagus irregularis TaxID=588596 RepID=A0A2I1H4C4_9GLOM|nr:S-adenosyl-L-methionine-dependent methyltransferase [Rhizophagus irregularis]CAB4430165.1 unnamed protein product [Rhizophagus irregularis]CAB4430262.1 unnamed protein product [Rhizophagus irregularis]